MSGKKASRSGKYGQRVEQRAGITAEQEKTLLRIAKRTGTLKKEQMRVVNEAGEIVLEKKGMAHEVKATVGEMRDVGKGAVQIHNHPAGGPFSMDDLNEFGYGMRATYVAAPEGIYKLINVKYGTKEQYNGWVAMKEEMERQGLSEGMSFTELKRRTDEVPRVKKALKQVNDLSDMWVKAHKAGDTQKADEIRKKFDAASDEYAKILHEERRIQETKPYDDFYKKNAKKFGFSYKLEKYR